MDFTPYQASLLLIEQAESTGRTAADQAHQFFENQTTR